MSWLQIDCRRIKLDSDLSLSFSLSQEILRRTCTLVRHPRFVSGFSVFIFFAFIATFQKNALLVFLFFQLLLSRLFLTLRVLEFVFFDRWIFLEIIFLAFIQLHKHQSLHLSLPVIDLCFNLFRKDMNVWLH